MAQPVNWSANPYYLYNPMYRRMGPTPWQQDEWTGGLAAENAPTNPTGFEALSGRTPTELPEWEPGGGYADQGPGPEVAGKMTSDERSQLSARTNPVGTGVREGWNAAFGEPESAFGKLAQDVTVGFTNKAAQALDPTGVLGKMGLFGGLVARADDINPTTHRSIMSPSPADMQAQIDRYGYRMGTPYGVTPGGIPGATDTTFGEPGPHSPDPGLNTTDMSLGEAVGIVGGDYASNDSNTDSGSHSETGEQGESGNNGMWGRGGFSRVERATPAVYGERGGEDAIFIPHKMYKKGKFGREGTVKKALRKSLRKMED